MPFSRVSAYGVSHGNLTDDERLKAQQAQTDLQAQLALQEMAARERMHGKSDSTQRYGIDQQTAVAGTFGQRAAHEGSLFDKKAAHEVGINTANNQTQRDVVGMQMKPALIGAELDKTKYEDQAGVDRYVNEMVLNRLKGLNAPAAPGAPGVAAPAAPAGMSDADVQMFGVLAALKGGGAMPDFQTQAMQRQVSQMQLEEMKRSQAKGRAQEKLAAGDVAGAKAAAGAADVTLDIPRIEEFLAGAGAGLTADLAQKAKSFAARDTSVTGWDPGQGDVDSVMSELARLVSVLESRGYPREVAVREAQRVISGNLGDDQNDVNAGWIQALKGSVGGFR